METARPQSIEPENPAGAFDEGARGGAAVEPGQDGQGSSRAASGPDVDELETCRRELEAARQENLRTIAEARNQAQRAIRDKQEALKYAEWNFAKDMLVVVDDLDRTLEAAGGGANVQTIVEGVRIVQEHLLKVLCERRIEPIDPQGEPFDPTWHEALMKQPCDDVPEGHVCKVIARGFRMHDRALRPAKVIVSSGPGGG